MEKAFKITVRVSEQMRNYICDRAIEKSMNVAEFMRYLVQKDLDEWREKEYVKTRAGAEVGE